MDIRELRIGDIIYRPCCNDTVVEIRKNGIIGLERNRGVIPFKNLKPIPLTDKWLERLGFEHISNGNYHKQIDNFDLLLIELVESYSIEITDCCLGNIMCNKNIKYLHQLQHELYDAGIEFKIELQ